MKTELRARLRELEWLLNSGAISQADYDLTLRERRGMLLGGKRLARRRKRDGIVASEVVSHEHSTSVQIKFALAAERAPEVVERDMRIRYDREMVKAGRLSVMVKIVKRSKVLTATLGELAEVSG